MGVTRPASTSAVHEKKTSTLADTSPDFARASAERATLGLARTITPTESRPDARSEARGLSVTYEYDCNRFTTPVTELDAKPSILLYAVRCCAYAYG